MNYLLSNKTPRKPVAKWAGKRYSPARLRRGIETLHPSFEAYFKRVFKTAENILQARLPPKSKIIFIGQGMRPLFEAARAINEFEQRFPRSNIRYLITPRGNLGTNDKNVLVKIVQTKLLKKKITSQKTENYFLVDNIQVGGNVRLVEEAIKQIQPNVEVLFISQRWRGFEGIMTSDAIERPTIKTRKGNLQAKSGQNSRIELLAFQQYLQKYLDEKYHPPNRG